MSLKKQGTAFVAAGLAFGLLACAPPPDASRVPVSSPPASSVGPTGPSGGSTEESKSPSPSPSTSKSPKPTASPSTTQRGYRRFSPAMAVGLQNAHEGLRDLPLLPAGTDIYRGKDSLPPYADEFGLIVSVEIPENLDYKKATDEYVESMLAQAWTVETFYPAHKAIPTQQYILTRGAWTAKVTGREYEGSKIITVSILLDGMIQ